MAAMGATKTGFIEGLVFGLLTSSSATIGLAGSALAISTITGLVTGGLAVGLNLLASSLFKPQSPKPEDVQQSVRQPSQPRARHYGRVKVSGPWVFAEGKEGSFYKILALGQGPIDAIEEFWLDDTHVTLDGNSDVIEGRWIGGDGSLVNIQNRLGGASETVYSHIAAAFPEWTSAHKGNGVASLAILQRPVPAEDFQGCFPNGINTNYRAVLRGCLVLNPVTGVLAWSDNGAAVILDYMKHGDGMRLPSSIFNTPLALAKWQESYTRCAQAITLNAGGTEPRYRLWGSYFLNERPADVLGRMLASTDGRLYPTSDGGLALDIGAWSEPTVILDADAIIGFNDVARGRDVTTTANVIRSTYLGPDQDYQTTDADPWIDEADVSARGEIERDTPFIMSPSHSQTRRLMKLDAYRANPTWVGAFQCNLRGLAALGERFVRIQYPLFNIDEVFEVQDFRFDIAEGNLLQGVTLNVQSMPSAAYQWSPDQEGVAPVRDDTVVDRTIPDPTGFNVTITRKTVAGSPVPYASLSFSAPPVASLKVQARGKRTADTQWIPIGVQDGATSAESFALSDGEQYEFQIRHVSASGKPGDWTSSIVITPVADTTAPGVVTGVGGTGGAGQVALTWTAPNSANYHATNIRRNTVNNEGTATLVRTEYGAPSTADSWTNTGLSAGTYYYWLKARNASGVESASVATGAKTVT
ncbi:fibronectin type III domain-containing protein [Mesorhizobium retamae]|uniref:Fibronectin type III domain-containing protein n=1 Tax=Mesorhizobium retamae TaxID=2912854 RepID=A0ABS9QHX2_9HYPH|nr:fibronectin type III domain-containing protein [Mesorhizobium sp. IRAMC:0171]MCG7507054.1 fibronectin type III domain-containing protein [Mesorhizobium sp. IRAMC:0171]